MRNWDFLQYQVGFVAWVAASPLWIRSCHQITLIKQCQHRPPVVAEPTNQLGVMPSSHKKNKPDAFPIASSTFLKFSMLILTQK